MERPRRLAAESRNWALEPADGGPLPTDPVELAIWKTFYGDDIKSIKRSNHRNVFPGSWRVEVSPAEPQLEDHFLHLFEINDRGKTGHMRVELVQSAGIAGAGCSATGEAGIVALFPAQEGPLYYVEATLPAFPCHTLWMGGLSSDRIYDLEVAGSNFASGVAPGPGVPLLSQQIRANQHGGVHFKSRVDFYSGNMSDLCLSLANECLVPNV